MTTANTLAATTEFIQITLNSPTRIGTTPARPTQLALRAPGYGTVNGLALPLPTSLPVFTLFRARARIDTLPSFGVTIETEIALHL